VVCYRAVMNALSPSDPEGMLRLPEAAQRAGVSTHTLRYWIRRGRLLSVLIAHRHHIRPADLTAAQIRQHLGTVLPAWRRDPPQAGRRLRALREAAGLSQLALAAASGLTHETISRLELGHKAPSAATLHKLVAALGVAPERLVVGPAAGLSLLTVAEAATRLEVPAERVRDWLSEGRLAGTKVSGAWRVPAVVVAELERSGRLRGRSRRLDPRYRG
jgi:excisionase family DNA binding protein